MFGCSRFAKPAASNKALPKAPKAAFEYTAKVRCPAHRANSTAAGCWGPSRENEPGQLTSGARVDRGNGAQERTDDLVSNTVDK